MPFVHFQGDDIEIVDALVMKGSGVTAHRLIQAPHHTRMDSDQSPGRR